MVRSGILIILVFPTLCGIASPQEPMTLVRVRVDDGFGASIPKAKIELSPLPGARSGLSAETDNEGNAGFEVPAGSYQVLVSSRSFCSHRWSVEIQRQQTLKLVFDLRVGPCHVSTVEVLGAPRTDQAESPGPISETSLLNVLVTDFSGARVSNADVQARCADSGLTSETTADAEGQALVALGAGNCLVSVRARGFKSFSQLVDHEGQSRQTLTAVLSVANQCGGCLSVEQVEEIEFQHLIPDGEIPAMALERLTLPEHKLHMHRRALSRASSQ